MSSGYLIGQSLEQMRAELKEMREKYPHLSEVQLRVHFTSKYGISHDSTGHLVTISLEEVFRDDSGDQQSSS